MFIFQYDSGFYSIMPYASPEARRRHRKRYYQTHRNIEIEKAKQWQAAHPERSHDLKLQYKHRNIEKIRERDRLAKKKKRDKAQKLQRSLLNKINANKLIHWVRLMTK